LCSSGENAIKTLVNCQTLVLANLTTTETEPSKQIAIAQERLKGLKKIFEGRLIKKAEQVEKFEQLEMEVPEVDVKQIEENAADYKQELEAMEGGIMECDD